MCPLSKDSKNTLLSDLLFKNFSEADIEDKLEYFKKVEFDGKTTEKIRGIFRSFFTKPDTDRIEGLVSCSISYSIVFFIQELQFSEKHSFLHTTSFYPYLKFDNTTGLPLFYYNLSLI